MNKTLLLVDGSSYLYRAFHAIGELRNSKGEPTNAIFGVLNMLRRLHKDIPADYSACIFDAKGKTFRDDIYPEYKANRTAMPDDLGVQIEPLLEAIRAMGWPLLIVDGVEADDVIGTLACQAALQGVRTIVSTGDKDMTQLVNPQVTLVNTMSNETLDEAGVEKKFGVKPERIVDYLSLVGDAIDNIPGVAKVGPKTAVKWLAQYGTLDNIIAHASEVGGAVGDNLRQVLDWLPQARGLLTIKCDVELPIKIEELAHTKPDIAKLAELRDKLRAANDAYWTEQADIQLQIASAWVAFAEGKRDDALKAMSAAADAEDKTEKSVVTPGPLVPARELYGAMLIESGMAKEAMAAFEATLEKEPNRLGATLGTAKAADKAGDASKARQYYAKAVALAQDADPVRPELAAARAFLAKN